MPKIAIHTFGHYRTAEQCLPSFKAFVLDANPDHDLFVHLWDRTNRETPSWYEIQKPVDDIGARQTSLIKDMLQPTAISMTRQSLTQDEATLPHVSALKMHESIRQSMALRPASAEHDLVLVTRLDILFRAPLLLARLMEIAQHGQFSNSVFSLFRDHTSWCESFWISDCFGGRDCCFFGAAPAMEAFRSIGEDRVIYARHPQQERTGEIYFDNFLFSHGLNLQLVRLLNPADWEVVRE